MAAADVDVDYALEAGVAHTNNIDRNPDDGLDETAGIARLNLDLAADTNRVDGRVALDVERRIYTKDSNDDETIGTLDAAFDFTLIDRLLTWQARDNFGQVLNDVFAPDNPQNREDVNVFSTGPVLTLPLNATNRFQLSALYRDVSFEDSPQNNDGLTGELSFIRALNANRNIAINVSSGSVDFDREIDTDFDRQSATVSFSSQTSRSNLELEVGRNRISFDSDRADREGSVIIASFRRDLTSRIDFAVNYEQQLSDSAQLFQQFLGDRNAGNAIGNPATDQNALADPLEQRNGGFTVTANQRHGSLFASVRFFDFDFEESNEQDRDGYQINIGGNRTLAGNWRLGFSASLDTNQFVTGRDDDNLQIRLSLDKQLTRTLSLRSSIAHIERDSNTNGQSFDEDVVRLTLVWEPGRQRGN